jgi:hypothetical protein
MIISLSLFSSLFDALRGRVVGCTWRSHTPIEASLEAGTVLVISGGRIDWVTFLRYGRAGGGDGESEVSDPNLLVSLIAGFLLASNTVLSSRLVESLSISSGRYTTVRCGLFS